NQSGRLSGSMCRNSNGMSFSRSTIAARCTHGQVLKLTRRYLAMTSSPAVYTRKSIAIQASSEPPPCTAITGPSAFADDDSAGSIGAQERCAGHLLGLRQIHQLEQRRRDIGEAAFADQGAVARAREHQRHRVRGVRGVRATGFGIAHHLAI